MGCCCAMVAAAPWLLLRHGGCCAMVAAAPWLLRLRNSMSAEDGRLWMCCVQGELAVFETSLDERKLSFTLSLYNDGLWP